MRGVFHAEVLNVDNMKISNEKLELLEELVLKSGEKRHLDYEIEIICFELDELGIVPKELRSYNVEDVFFEYII